MIFVEAFIKQAKINNLKNLELKAKSLFKRIDIIASEYKKSKTKINAIGEMILKNTSLTFLKL